MFRTPCRFIRPRYVITSSHRPAEPSACMQRRGYVAKRGGSLEATARGRLLSAFLRAYFQRYVDYGFTASMEDSLDAVSSMSLLCLWSPVYLLT